MAKVQKLKVSLEEAQEDLKDTEYDKWHEDQTDMLDNLADEVEDFWERIMDDLRKNIDGSLDNILKMVTDNPEAVARALDALGLGDALSIITTYNPDGTHTDKATDYGGNSYESTYDKTGTNVNNRADTSIDDMSSEADDLKEEIKRVTGTASDLNKVLQDGKEAFSGKAEKGKDNLIQAVQNQTSSEHNIADTASNTATAGKGSASNDIRAGKNAEIDSFLKKNLRKPKNTTESMRIATDELLQYLDKKYNKKGYLTEAKEAELAKMLGVSLNDKKNINYYESVKLRDALKNAGFADGGIAGTLNKAALENGDDGWITIQKGEAVLTEAQTEAVQTIADHFVPVRPLTAEQESILTEYLNTPYDYSAQMHQYGNAPIYNTMNTPVNVGGVTIHLDGSGIKDEKSFCDMITHSTMVQSAIDQTVGKGITKAYANTFGRF